MAAVFQSACLVSTDFSNTGANTTFGGTNGMVGTLGSSPSVRVNSSGTDYVFEGIEKALPSACTIFSFAFRVESATTLTTGLTIFTACLTSAYDTGTSPFRLDISVNGTGYMLSAVDASNSYAYTAGTAVLTKGMDYEICIAQTSAGWKVYINNSTTPDITYAFTQSTVGLSYMTLGTHYQNAATSVVGYINFSNIWCGNLNATPGTLAAQVADAYQGYKQRHLAAVGMVYRGPADGQNNSYQSGYADSVSEAVVYYLKLAVQNADQAGFILADNWTLNNMLRSKSTTANTQGNGAPTTGLNLMCFHFNSANSDGKGPGTIYDANDATDADPERAQALLWAHARWGSSAFTVGSANELVTPNYRQRAQNVMDDLRLYRFTAGSTGYQYQWNDSFQSGTTIQMGGDYPCPAAYKLFAQYDTTNATFWNNAYLGGIDAHNKAANVIFSGGVAPYGAQASTAKLTPNWFAFNTTNSTVSTTPSTYTGGDSDYGFNSFRMYPRLWDAYAWYNDSAALTAIQQPKTFFTNEWSANTKIRATFRHDGTNTGNYETNMFVYSAYFTLKAGDASNTTASAIKTNKLSNLYFQQPYGSIFTETAGAGTAAYGYFGQSWMIPYVMMDNGMWQNYGQAAAVTVNHNALLLLGVG